MFLFPDSARLCLGNTGWEIGNLLAADPRLGICCDVNHLLKEAPEDFIREQDKRIFTVHMSDCDGKDERHWMPVCRILQRTDHESELSIGENL
ncbi:hypothetical protein P4H39_18635 [Paenibacillus lautus]|uniref:hypothetical protein n=1 Tax=Paenibacillus lautus TaxID=1401 RepID=UPI002DB8801B|nr:hypothetical protein [Paenibacillus lautus]MEC0204624.1 hypothetical protein [Paenibacillus lautus]